MTKPKDTPSIYIDTCIARDILNHRPGSRESSDLINNIRNKGWQCKMSVFGLMELVDVEQERLFVESRYFVDKKSLDEVYSARRKRDLSKEALKKSFDYVETFKEAHPFIEIVGLDDKGWSLAIVVATDSNLHASDVIHLVSAWMEDCHVVVTKDAFFIKEATRYLKEIDIWEALKICKPKDCLSQLTDVGLIGT